MSTTNLKDFIRDYLARGFGSMNKNDFEVWIFQYLIENKFPNNRDYEISIELGIPISKVKRLRYEASLKFGKHEKKDYEAGFRKLLENVKFTKDGESVKFIVEDFALRKYLEFVLKSNGHLSDGSFNSEIITMSLDAFEYLLQHFWTKKEYDDFLDKAKKSLGKDVTFKDILKKLGKAVASVTFKELLSRGISFTIENLPQIIEIIQNL